MSARHVAISVRPDRCDGCGACVSACARRLIRAGAGYLYVDPAGCDGCAECVRACTKGAIVAGRASGAIGTPVVRSRAEAKALRRAAEQEHEAARRPARPVVVPDAAEVDGAWSLLDAVAMLSVLLVAFLAKEAVLGSAPVAAMPESGRMIARGSVLAAFYAIQLVALAFVARRHGRTLGDAFTGDERQTRDIVTNVALVVGLFVLARLVSVTWGKLALLLGLAAPVGERMVELFGTGAVGLGVTVAVVVLLAPVCEELIFRGVVLGALERRFGRWPAIIGSSAAFAAFHVTPWILVSMLALGVALGWLASARRSLIAAIALHVLYNGSAVAAAFWLAR